MFTHLHTTRPQEGPLLHFLCSMVAGLACATTTAPVDIVKTRYMNQGFCGEGRPQRYAGMADCFMQASGWVQGTLGVGALWRERTLWGCNCCCCCCCCLAFGAGTGNPCCSSPAVHPSATVLPADCAAGGRGVAVAGLAALLGAAGTPRRHLPAGL